jgi:hypothetical protein
LREARRRRIEARSQFEEERDQNTDLFSVSKLTRSINYYVDLSCSNLRNKLR